MFSTSRIVILRSKVAPYSGISPCAAFVEKRPYESQYSRLDDPIYGTLKHGLSRIPEKTRPGDGTHIASSTPALNRQSTCYFYLKVGEVGCFDHPYTITPLGTSPWGSAHRSYAKGGGGLGTSPGTSQGTSYVPPWAPPYVRPSENRELLHACTGEGGVMRPLGL